MGLLNRNKKDSKPTEQEKNDKPVETSLKKEMETAKIELAVMSFPGAEELVKFVNDNDIEPIAMYFGDNRMHYVYFYQPAKTE